MNNRVHAPDHGASRKAGGSRQKAVLHPITRRPLHFEAPAACTTPDAVRERALWPTLDVNASVTEDMRDLAAIFALTPGNAAVHERLGRLIGRAVERRDTTHSMAGYLDVCVGNLEDARDRKCYDGLADLTVYTCRETANLLKPWLDVIRRMDLTHLREAQAALVPWFEQLGDSLFEERTMTEIGAKREKVLRAEHERWLRFGAEASS